MRLVHSFVSDKCSETNFRIQMGYFALSCLYAKENGFNIVLHSDNKTADFLRELPYDDIICDLEGKSSPANDKIFAWGKFEAMKNEDLGNIHIDGDVFLKDPKLIDLLNFDNYDLIVQNLETPEGTGYEIKNINLVLANGNRNTECFKNCIYPEGAKKECKAMFNCGIVGFNNQDLKDLYYNTYWDMVNQYAKTGINIPSVPDLIIEQQFLKDITDFYGYKAKMLLDKVGTPDATEIGYQHVIGGTTKAKYLETVKKLVRKHNLEIYNKIINIWEN